MKRVCDCLPNEALQDWDCVRSYWENEVTVEHKDKWPGPQKYVSYWIEIGNGLAIGWNENPSRGWSFPVIRMKAS
jgi:hypothetical protein